MPIESLWTPWGDIPVSDIRNGKVSFPDKKVPLDVSAQVLDVMMTQAQLRHEASADQHEAQVEIETTLPWLAVFITGD